MSWGWDSNVREAMERAQRLDDHFLRLYIEGEAAPISRGPTHVGLRLRGLTERYDRYATESRLQAEGALEVLRRLSRSSSVWGNARFDGRVYPDSTERNYGRGTLNLGTSFPLRKGRLGLAASFGGIDYRRTGSFDRRHQSLSVDLRLPAVGGIEPQFLGRLEWSRYGRQAIKRIGPDLFGFAGHQDDHVREATLHLSLVRGWLFEATGSWQSVRSNSFGYSVGRLGLELGATGWAWGGVLVQVHGRLESVDYHDPGLDRVFLVRTGEDQEAGEDNNHIQVWLRRSLRERLALDARYSHFRNESLLVGSFYHKSIVSLGLLWQPWGASDF